MADVDARIELEARIRDGARSMLHQLDVEGTGSEMLKSQILHELQVAEKQLITLQARKDALQQDLAELKASGYFRPRAVRAIRGLEDLNRAESPFSLPYVGSDGETYGRVVRMSKVLVRILSILGGQRSMRQAENAPPVPPPRGAAQSQARIMAFMVRMLQTYPRLRHEISNDSCIVPILTEAVARGSNDHVRGYAWLLLRYILCASVLAEPHVNVLSLFLGCALLREDKRGFEREQALKFVRTLLSLLPEAHALVTPGIVRILVAIAEAPADPLRLAAVETLAELALLDTPLAASTSALRPIWQAICVGPPARSCALVQCLLGLLDRPATRQYICPGMDLEAALASYASNKSEHDVSQCVALQLILSWQGFSYLCMNGGAALRTLLDALRLGNESVRASILELLLSLFQPAVLSARDDRPKRTRPPPIPLLRVQDQYLGLVLQIMLDHGLMPALVATVQHTTSLRDTAAYTLVLVLRFARRILPRESVALLAFPSLVHAACHGTDDQLSAKMALLSIDAMDARLPKEATDGAPPDPCFDVGLDDLQFRAMIRDSSVTREYTTWNLEVMCELLGGPLQSAKRFEEAAQSTKFIRRLLSFFRPSHQQYVSLRNSEANKKWTALGIQLFRVLLMHAEGRSMLMEDAFLVELRDAFDQLVLNTPDALFNERTMHSTMIGGYFDFLQIMSSTVQGLELMHTSRLFSPMLQLCSMADHAWVVEALILALEYTHDSLARVVLERAMIAGAVHVRLSAGVRLRESLWLDGAPQKWAVKMLLAQLHDVEPQVRLHAAQIVLQACVHPTMLACVLAQQPLLDLLSAEEDTLFLRALSHPASFARLYRSGYVQRQTHAWFARYNAEYVEQAQEALRATFSGDPVPLPPHLYGELTATEEGCAYLRQIGHIELMVRQLQGEDADLEKEHALKSCIWVLGHAGSNDDGLELLLEYDAVQLLAARAKTATTVSLKATCFYAMGLLAKSSQSAPILARYDWTVVQGRDSATALPCDAAQFVALPASAEPSSERAEYLAASTDSDEARIVALLSSLGNSIVAQNTWHALTKLRAKYPAQFQRPALLCRALSLMDSFPMQLGVRRQIWSLFDQMEIAPTLAKELAKLRADLLVSRHEQDAEPQRRHQGQPACKQPTYMYVHPVWPLHRKSISPEPAQEAEADAWTQHITTFAQHCT
ncbi:hypothetical protein MVES1_000640 [Malassezia vespertilionis]|uniref:REM-1 domain-containing protein n=1 Tax=Malassezia vespertilionis TaxID=2020962 RepID=A0A2N1JFX9_9BASI|nr:uncharacterized protein MVES1_000640 [Malassezia vespertilionis]PKI85452.1 hypothetical protein MVES_000592 [Malassezia vespertilionis]WFD05310.1 hypothetical protein MVES1_000640 [Malassezia vespertilionis]